MNKVDFMACLGGGISTIRESAAAMCRLLSALAKANGIFSDPVIGYGRDQEIPIRLNTTEQALRESIESAIMELFRKDIKKRQKVSDLTPDFSREDGFTFHVSYKPSDGIKIFFNVCLGYVFGSQFSLSSATRGAYFDFATAYGIVKALAGCGVKDHVSSRIDHSSYYSAVIPYRLPLGWITYISKQNPIQIPEGLPGLEYVHEDDGVYLIATREDITKDDQLYEATKVKLLGLMETVAGLVPGYRKD